MEQMIQKGPVIRVSFHSKQESLPDVSWFIRKNEQCACAPLVKGISFGLRWRCCKEVGVD